MSDVLPEAGKAAPLTEPTAETGNDGLSARVRTADGTGVDRTGVDRAGIGGAGVDGAAADGAAPGVEPSATATEPPGSVADETAAETDATGPPSRAKRRRRWLFGWLTVIVLGAAVALGLRLFVVQTFFVPSGSMTPTLQIGDRMLVLKVGYSVQRGAIVVFHRPPGDLNDPNQDDLVKRVIGMPGETIWSVGSKVYIDGRPLAEPWLPKVDPLGPPIARQKIPSGDYFMMGDNRSDSLDSRDWGPLPRSYIIGRVFLVIWRNGKPDFHVI